MAILVDPAIWPWRGRRWAHLISDASYEELHAFAARLGLRREHFQGDHYDVPTALRERAVGLGAEPVAARDLVRRLRAAGLRRPRPGRPAGAPDETSSSPQVLLVDGANVIGARPDGWWRDRPRAARRLHTGLALLRRRGDAGTDADVVLVLEGAAVEGLEEGRHAGVRVAWARRRGRDAADDRIVELVTELRGDGVAVGVVTSDRALAARVREAGGHVQGAGAFRRHVDALLEDGGRVSRERRSRSRRLDGGAAKQGHEMLTPFQVAVAAALAHVGPGEVVTYGELAAEAGRPGAARGVARALRALERPAWWRVVPASGLLVHRPEEAARRLRAEGVEVTTAGRVRSTGPGSRRPGG